MKYSLGPWAKPDGFPEGPDNISSYFLTQFTIQTFSDLPGRSILEELILCIALKAGQYGKV